MLRYKAYRQASALSHVCGASEAGAAGSTSEAEFARVSDGECRLSLPAMSVYWNGVLSLQQPIDKPHVLKDG
jgi:hypothetical protein